MAAAKADADAARDKNYRPDGSCRAREAGGRRAVVLFNPAVHDATTWRASGSATRHAPAQSPTSALARMADRSAAALRAPTDRTLNCIVQKLRAFCYVSFLDLANFPFFALHNSKGASCWRLITQVRINRVNNDFQFDKMAYHDRVVHRLDAGVVRRSYAPMGPQNWDNAAS